MPTHREFPWERDARAARGVTSGASRSTPRPATAERPHARVLSSSRGLRREVGGVEIFAALAIAGILIALKVHGLESPAPPSVAPPPTTTPTFTSSPGHVRSVSITELRSRFVGKATLQVWGRVNAPDGTTVRLRIGTPGSRTENLAAAPVVAGRFFASARVPEKLRGRRVSVSARALR